MKVLTIKEPYASLIATNKKHVEIRSWKTKFTGEFYIHASKKPDKENLDKYKEVIDIDNLSCGNIIARCNLVDCALITESFMNDYNKKFGTLGYTIGSNAIGEYAFILEDIKKLEKKIPAKGKLSFWTFEK